MPFQYSFGVIIVSTLNCNYSHFQDDHFTIYTSFQNLQLAISNLNFVTTTLHILLQPICSDVRSGRQFELVNSTTSNKTKRRYDNFVSPKAVCTRLLQMQQTAPKAQRTNRINETVIASKKWNNVLPN